ncbi:MAG TPA: hypothetical protein PKJ51_03820 [Methanothrix sp.]|jgi:hypothetical protein|nr:hypothetical protein [Methanothrix sp.]
MTELLIGLALVKGHRRIISPTTAASFGDRAAVVVLTLSKIENRVLQLFQLFGEIASPFIKTLELVAFRGHLGPSSIRRRRSSSPASASAVHRRAVSKTGKQSSSIGDIYSSPEIITNISLGSCIAGEIAPAVLPAHRLMVTIPTNPPHKSHVQTTAPEGTAATCAPTTAPGEGFFRTNPATARRIAPGLIVKK